MIQDISSKEDFKEKILLDSSWLVFVDFWASWCGPCRVLSPIIEELAEENKDSLKVYRLDVDKLKEVVMEYEITSIPTILVFKDWKMVEKPIQGVLPKEVFQEVINNRK